MFRLLRLTALVGGGAFVGFVLALFFQWTFALSLAHTSTHFDYRTAADGSIVRLPTDIDDFNLTINSQPYKEAKTFDLFDTEGKDRK